LELTIAQTRVKFGFLASIPRSVNYFTTTLVETFRFLGRARRGNVSSSDAAGPVAIVAIISEAVRYSGEKYCGCWCSQREFGIMNLLPIPAWMAEDSLHAA
jgi:regulator of sigma E protease